MNGYLDDEVRCWLLELASCLETILLSPHATKGGLFLVDVNQCGNGGGLRRNRSSLQS